MNHKALKITSRRSVSAILGERLKGISKKLAKPRRPAPLTAVP